MCSIAKQSLHQSKKQAEGQIKARHTTSSNRPALEQLVKAPTDGVEGVGDGTVVGQAQQCVGHSNWRL